MFGKLIGFLASGVTGLLAKYAIRASVAVPFAIALAFALAGLTVVLINEYGYQNAYFLLAAGFASVGGLGIVAVWFKERNEARQQSRLNAVKPDVVATSVVRTAKEVPQAVADGVSDAPSNFRALARGLARNWPLVLAGALALVLLEGAAPKARNGWHER